jgi:hypothetical protein
VFAQPSVKFRTAHVSVSTISIGCRNIITKKILANAQLSVAAGDGLKQQLCLLYRCIEVFDLKKLRLYVTIGNVSSTNNFLYRSEIHPLASVMISDNKRITTSTSGYRNRLRNLYFPQLIHFLKYSIHSSTTNWS